jgi:magnesium chelatase family protein
MQVMAYAPFGADGIVIRVEADIRRGIPGIDITGLAEGAVREARERVRAAFRNSGYVFPQDRILINLAPAGVRKDGAFLDLPIALSVMAAAGLIPGPMPGSAGPEGDGPPLNLMVLGELELSGRLRPVRGVLAATAAGLRSGIRDFIVPAENAREAAILSGGRYAAAATLGEAAHALMILAETGAFPAAESPNSPRETSVFTGTGSSVSAVITTETGDFAEVKGQSRYKRALEIAAAGGHNLLVFGPPGAGKTMLARRLPSIAAPLTLDEAVEVTRLHSLAGQLRISQSGLPSEDCLIAQPPFRSPHHSASAEGILGGGKAVRPGEITLANFGFLFLDEAPEFRTNVLQALREPLEDRVITISRAEGPVRLPADFQLLLSANTCPCGRLGIRAPSGGAAMGCFCTPEEIHRYWRKFSGALLDRVELRVPVLPPQAEHLERNQEESSAVVARRVTRAAAIQRERFANTAVRRNARMTVGMIEQYCALTGEAQRAFRLAADKLNHSGRSIHGIIRVSRTIADLEGEKTIGTTHILEAIQHHRFGEDPYDILSV